jgi:enoyl-CoA hydratase/carnithine racemase
MSYVALEIRDGVAHVRLNRPERLNAISAPLLDDLHSALRESQTAPEVKVILLSGEGRAFCAGDDLKEFEEQTRTPSSIRHHIERIQQITRDLMFGDRPVVGAINGYAVGGGFEWVLNCDLVVAADNLVCFFPEMEWCQFVTGGVTYLLPQAVGHQQAMRLWLLGERQSAHDLLQMGIANWVVPQEQVLSKAFDVARAITTKSAFSVARLKRAMATQMLGALAAALEVEQDATIAAFGTAEAAARVKKFGRVG